MTNPGGGDGGVGLSSSIDGSATTRGGGGGAGEYAGNPTVGGTGGGGDGTTGSGSLTNYGLPGHSDWIEHQTAMADTNTGGGGGGTGGIGALGGNGGSGIVIIRYVR